MHHGQVTLESEDRIGVKLPVEITQQRGALIARLEWASYRIHNTSFFYTLLQTLPLAI